MQFVIYNNTTGAPIRVSEASIQEDVELTLPEDQDAIAYEGDIGGVYILLGPQPMVTPRFEITSAPDKTVAAVGEVVTWNLLPADTAVFVDDSFVGRVEADGVVALTVQSTEQITVSFRGTFHYKRKDWIINAS